MKTLIQHGTIINSDDTLKTDVLVENGKIIAVGENLNATNAKTVDASGKYILPGAIDAHTHLEMPFNGTVSADSYFAGTRAAACGGVTTVFDFAIQRKGMSIQDIYQERNALCKPQACVDYAFHVALTDLTDAVLDEFEDAVKAGLVSYKLFMVYKKDGLMMNDADIYRALLRSNETGALISVHAENPDLIDYYTEKFLKSG